MYVYIIQSWITFYFLISFSFEKADPRGKTEAAQKKTSHPGIVSTIVCQGNESTVIMRWAARQTSGLVKLTSRIWVPRFQGEGGSRSSSPKVNPNLFPQTGIRFGFRLDLGFFPRELMLKPWKSKTKKTLPETNSQKHLKRDELSIGNTSTPTINFQVLR